MKAIVEAVKKEVEDIVSLHLLLEKPITYVPGQYVMISEPGEKKHAFSIVSASGNKLRLVIKKLGDFTGRLSGLKQGHVFELVGPYGRFNLPTEDKNIVFIAGGIGITPLYSMAKFGQDNRKDLKMDLFYCVKARDMAAMADEVDSLESKNIHIHDIYTNDGSRLSIGKIKELVPDFKSRYYYICGPPPMMEDFRKNLTLEGIPDEHIRTEEFS
ncbi:MAG: FAD-dependent oxidoreductase [Nanoarchaeota archaeon]|nr:FAD-dependent oxidoreductase [Nanoarchaeota archaeon]